MMSRLSALCLMALAVTSPSLAGDLNPPAGPVTATGRFGPRTEINKANTPGDANSVFRITRPGSYYLGGNIVGPSGSHGIEVNSDNITIDLMGFELRGQPGSLDGIHSNSKNSIAIRNGTIRSWGGDGIDLVNSFSFLIEDVIVRGVGGNGMVANFLGIIRNCSISECQTGIVTNCCTLVRDCHFGSCTNFAITGSQSITVLDCVTSNCDGGISTSNSSLIARCTIGFGSGEAIRVGSNSLVIDNYVDGSTTGINVTGVANRIDSNHVVESGTGIRVTGTGNLVVRNFATLNATGYSVVAGNLMGPIVTTATILTNNSPHANYLH